MTTFTPSPTNKIDQKNVQPSSPALQNRKAEIEKMYLSNGLEVGPIIFSLACLLIIYLGWKTPLEYYISAESGLGYFLGIFGFALMVLTLLYSLRKRLKSMRKWGSLRSWFTAHMILGIIGPIAILYHANFSFGSSKNEQIAMISMLIVVLSGIIGRYIHDKIRYRIFIEESKLEEQNLTDFFSKNGLSHFMQENPKLLGKIQSQQNFFSNEQPGLIKSFLTLIQIKTLIRTSILISKKQLKSACQRLAEQENWSQSKLKSTLNKSNNFLESRYQSIQKIASYHFFERLFSIWFFLHVPLFYMMIITVIFHIIIVHLYSAHPI